MDYENIERYKQVTGYFTGYEYNEKDQLVRCYIVEGDELQQVDTFSYDDKERLVMRSQLNDFYSWNKWDEATRSIWTFQYSRNRLIHCDLQEYGRGYQSDFSSRKEKPALRIEKTESYDFTYDKKDAVAEMKKRHRDSYSDYTSKYLILSEYY